MNISEAKITIAGVGGVGGLLAALLIRRYGDRVTLIARGKRAEHFRQQGLTLHGDHYGEFTVHPSTVTEDASELPVQDVILVCVKNDAIDTISRQIRPIVGPETLVMPVMNGVTAGRRLRKALGAGHVLESVIYTVSSAEADFSVVQKGKFTQIFAGDSTGNEKAQEGCRQLCSLMEDAGIECHYSDYVLADIWKKYVLNCAYNVVTARWGVNIGQIKASPEMTADYQSLLTEAWQVGKAAGVRLDENMVASHMRRLQKTTDDSTSSLSRDFDKGCRGEMEVFSGEIVRMAHQYGVNVPVSIKYYEGLQQRAEAFTK